jgi:hypothetical protein
MRRKEEMGPTRHGMQQLISEPREMEMTSKANNVIELKEAKTKFEHLLDNIDAAYIAYNNHFEKILHDQRLAEFSRRIDEAHDKVSDAIHAETDDEVREKLTDLAKERAEARPHKTVPLIDPKVVRENARRHAEETKRRIMEKGDDFHLNQMNVSAAEREEIQQAWEEGIKA